MTDRKAICRDDQWLTSGDEVARVISTAIPDKHFPVLACVEHQFGYRLIHARLDGTVNSRPGVAHPDDFVELLS